MLKPYKVWIATPNGTQEFRIDALCMDDAIAAARSRVTDRIHWTGAQRAD